MQEQEPALFGSYPCKMDSTGRIVFPRDVRRALNSKEWVAVKWFDDCLAVYPKDYWIELARKAHRSSSYSKEDRRMRRAFIGGAVLLKPDSQGRTVIPSPLRDFAGLRDNVVLVGDMDKVEIWSAALYEAEERKQNKNVDTSFEKMLNRALSYTPPCTVSEAEAAAETGADAVTDSSDGTSSPEDGSESNT